MLHSSRGNCSQLHLKVAMDTYGECAERQRDELTVLESMYPEAVVKEEMEICIMEGCVAGVAFEVRADWQIS